MNRRPLLPIRAFLLLVPLLGCTEPDSWQRHTIDDEYVGADGVDLGDIDQDGDPDAVVGWEESGLVIAYENPGASRVRGGWRQVDIRGGLELSKVEDVRTADLDTDGAIDAVISATEVHSYRLNIHWLQHARDWLSTTAWRGTSIGPEDQHGYLRAAVGSLDGAHGADIVVGTKHKEVDGVAHIGQLLWFPAPAKLGPEHGNLWNARLIAETGWVNNVRLHDMDGDGDNDILVSDRAQGLRWVENRLAEDATWTEHPIGENHGDFALCPGLFRQGELAIAAFLRTRPMIYTPTPDGKWYGQELIATNALPDGSIPKGLKGMACADLDLNGLVDIAVSVSGYGHGVFAYLQDTDQWQVVPVAGTRQNNLFKGIKHDTLSLADLDQDGDLDIVTTEENGGLLGRGLGFIWFENPAR